MCKTGFREYRPSSATSTAPVWTARREPVVVKSEALARSQAGMPGCPRCDKLREDLTAGAQATTLLVDKLEHDILDRPFNDEVGPVCHPEGRPILVRSNRADRDHVIRVDPDVAP